MTHEHWTIKPRVTCTNVFPYKAGTKRSSSGTKGQSARPILHWEASSYRTLAEDSVYLPLGPGERYVVHDFVYGDPNFAAIYQPRTISHRREIEPIEVKPKDVLYLLQNMLDMTLIISRLESLGKHQHEHEAPWTCVESLQALQAAEKIYERLTDAKVDLQICQRSLHTSNFSRRLQEKKPGSLHESSNPVIASLKMAFSCITLFQTGHVDMDQEDMEGVMAISHGDSMFVAQCILLDPSQPDIVSPVRRIVGNLGNAGLSVLIPPQLPEMRERALSDWRIVNHAPFDGRYEDNFTATSLHLTFTGYELPIGVKDRGSLSHEAFLVETVISVYDGGDWVADLDILRALKNSKHGWADHIQNLRKIRLPSLVSIDSWHELIDSPQSSAIVRASGNQQARLAIATVASQLDYDFRIIHAEDHPDIEIESPESLPPEHCTVTTEHSPDGSGSESSADLGVLAAYTDLHPYTMDLSSPSEFSGTSSNEERDITDVEPRKDTIRPDNQSSLFLQADSDFELPNIDSLGNAVLYIC